MVVMYITALLTNMAIVLLIISNCIKNNQMTDNRNTCKDNMV